MSTVHGELLVLLARQSRWVPLPVFCGALLIFAISYGSAPTPWLSVWLAGVVVVLSLRFLVLGRLPQMDHLSERARLRIAALMSGANGVMHGSSVGFLPFLGEFERFIVFMTILAFCAGSVSSTAGYRPVFFAYLVPTLVPLSVMWAIDPGGDVDWRDLFVAFLTLLYGLVLVRLSYDAFRLFRESMQIRLEQIELNARLERALDESRVANAAKTRFLATASHDLRQPVHALALFCSSLSRRPLDARTADIAGHITSAVDTLSMQLDALLDVSRLDAGIVEPHPTVFELEQMLERLREQFAPLAEVKNLTLTLACPPEATVRTDEMLLEQVVRNLLGNAVKYTDSGSVALSVTERDAHYTLEIADTGRGIPADAQPHLFEEFYQVQVPGRSRPPGLGLGLSIAKRLVDLLQIPLQMESAVGRGTKFTLTLSAAAGPLPAPVEQASAAVLDGLRALVIDDEPEVLAGMRLLLEDMGCDVATAESKAEGLAAAARTRPDVVVSDLLLGHEETGLQAVRELRALHPALPAVLLTADTAPERWREADEAQIVLLHKPIRGEALAAAIRHSCPSPERHEAAR
ncbi:MAG: hybrid sensor histidine kinase/response regulator [Gammaproteobacteria bacterium]|nr:hybrid sensor histidine kinase/response regulator [Gammaproteobacteria bacterium]